MLNQTFREVPHPSEQALYTVVWAQKMTDWEITVMFSTADVNKAS